MNIPRKTFGKIAIALLAFFVLSLIALEKAEAENLVFRFITVNPSATKTQDVQIKKYLPEEVTPEAIVDSGDLELEYDTDKSLYYVYNNSVTLTPKEIRTFEVEIKDIWTIPEEDLSSIAKRTKSMLAHFENTQYYSQGRMIANEVSLRLDEIRTSQVDETASRQQHIGIYRDNLVTLKGVKEDLARMEKILVTIGGPPAPEVLADTRIIGEAPSKTMTWIVIFIIIIFLGLLAGVMFFTWQHQARVTKEALLESKKAAFPKSEPSTCYKRGPVGVQESRISEI
jgi:hypothetical protein